MSVDRQRNEFSTSNNLKEIVMKKAFMGWTFLVTLAVILTFASAQAQESKTVKLPEPSKKGGLTIMESLAKRASSRAWIDKELSSQDLSNLLWAANGINRPDAKKRTAPSALNSQDVDIYVFMKSGVYLYDAANHALNLIVSGDRRAEILKSSGAARPAGESPAGAPGGSPSGAPGAGGGTAGKAPAGAQGGSAGAAPGGAAPAGGQGVSAPVTLLLVSDVSKFSIGTDEKKRDYGAIDTGLVSENISLFCAGNGLATVPRASINRDLAKTMLNLKDTQVVFLENSVGYTSESK
jgi:hypothetical protein